MYLGAKTRSVPRQQVGEHFCVPSVKANGCVDGLPRSNAQRPRGSANPPLDTFGARRSGQTLAQVPEIGWREELIDVVGEVQPIDVGLVASGGDRGRSSGKRVQNRGLSLGFEFKEERENCGLVGRWNTVRLGVRQRRQDESGGILTSLEDKVMFKSVLISVDFVLCRGMEVELFELVSPVGGR